MKKLIALIYIVVGAALPHLNSGVANVTDGTITAYWLDASTELQFNAVDSQISDFWAGWAGRDSLCLTPDSNSHPDYNNWTGQHDAFLTVKCAGGINGLYFLFSVMDDSFLDTTGVGPYGELLGIFLDTNSAATIDTCSGCQVGLYSSSLTYTTRLIDFPFAAAGDNLNQLRFNFYDRYAGGFTGGISYSFDAANDQLGMRVKRLVIHPDSLVYIELLLPWTLCGLQSNSQLPLASSGGVVPPEGGCWAFSVWYIDNDTSSNDRKALSSTGYVPWDGSYWGDIVFGPGFPAVPTPVESLLSVQPRAGSRAGAQRAAATGMLTYSLDGRRIEKAAMPETRVPSVRVVADRQRGVGKVVVQY